MEKPKRIAASQILEEHVRPNDHVLVIGPNFSPMLDPSSFFLATHLEQGKGRLTLLDNKSTELLGLANKKIDQLRQGGKRPGRKLVELHAKLREGNMDRIDKPAGTGDPHAYGRTMRSFRTAGFQITLPRTLISNAKRIQMPPNSVDVVFEHGTLSWINDVPGALAQYLRGVKPGGKVIIFTHDKLTQAHDEIKKIMEGMDPEKQAQLAENDPRRQIASVTETSFVPAYSMLGFLQRGDRKKIKLEKLDGESLRFFTSTGENHFWMLPLKGVATCSRGFNIQKKG